MKNFELQLPVYDSEREGKTEVEVLKNENKEYLDKRLMKFVVGEDDKEGKKAKKMMELILEAYEYYDEGMDIEYSPIKDDFEKMFGEVDFSKNNNVEFNSKMVNLLNKKFSNKEIDINHYSVMVEMLMRNNSFRLEKLKLKTTESQLVEGAKNKRGFMMDAPMVIERLKNEVKRGEINNVYGVVFMYLDIDNFKSFNDTYSHADGNKAIKEVGRLLLNRIKTTDILGHLHGDEFVILLTNTNIDKISKVHKDEVYSPIERFKKSLDEIYIDVVRADGSIEKVQVTVSCGVSEFKIDPNWTDKQKNDFIEKSDSSEIIESIEIEADKKLQKAKEKKDPLKKQSNIFY